MHIQKSILIALICHLFLLSGPVHADDTSSRNIVIAGPQAGDREKLYEIPSMQKSETGSSVLFFPPGGLYRVYAADPLRDGFGIQPLAVLKSEIPDAGTTRISLRVGGKLGIVRSTPGDRPDLGWQISLMGGFNDQNDIRHSFDNIGWDGHYGLQYEKAADRGLAFKFAAQHDSSHVGDEFIQRTGRKRLGYTREELAAGASWFVTSHWRVYSEAGWAFTMGDKELQQPWRVQLGMEYESSPKYFGGLFGWYAAADSQAWEERDWRIDVAVQTGLVAHSAGRTWRFGIEWYNGRPPIGEFFQYTERYLSAGVWIDL